MKPDLIQCLKELGHALHRDPKGLNEEHQLLRLQVPSGNKTRE
jgi:hypothetical protein